jgi:hypothetical protein
MENTLETAGIGERLAESERLLFTIGDVLSGMAMGVFTTLAVRALVWPGMDMVVAMMIGMAAGMLVHVVVGLALGALIGMFYAMIPASVIGMYGGMLFGMRDSMGAGSRTLGAALVVGAIFGAVVVAVVRIYDFSLRGAVVENEKQ